MHWLYQLSLIPPLALGITDEDDLLELKGTKKKKGKKIDDPDFMVGWGYFSYWIANVSWYQPTMHPILEKDVPKVVQAIRQTTSRKVLSKLMTRIKVYANDIVHKNVIEFFKQ